MSKFSLHLIGTFRLVAPGGEVLPISSKRSMALFALLATSPTGERNRQYLSSMLWQRSSPEQAASSLRTELKQLSALLNRYGAVELLSKDRRNVRINLQMIDIDIDGSAAYLRTEGQMEDADFLEGFEINGCISLSSWLNDQREKFDRIRKKRLLEFESYNERVDVLGSAVPSTFDVMRNRSLDRPPKPSVAVLPFRTVSEADRWIGFALSDQISVLLSFYSQLFVVSAGSAASMASQGILPHEIANRLGVQYTVEGSVISAGDRLRVSISLVDSDTRQQIWGEVFNERADGSGFIEKLIADRLAPQIWSKVHATELSLQMRRLGIGSSRYERWWKANALFRSYEPGAVREATRLAEALVEEDTLCPYASSLASFLNGLVYLMGLAPKEEAPQRRAILHCQSALRTGAENIEVLGYSAGGLLLSGADIELADRLINRALSILPSYQPTLLWGGWVDVVAGRPERARSRLELALRINPATNARAATLCAIGLSLLQTGQPDQALEVLLEAQNCDPAFPLSSPGIFLAATLLGERDIAEKARVRLSGPGSLRFIELLRSPQQREFFRSAIQSALDRPDSRTIASRP